MVITLISFANTIAQNNLPPAYEITRIQQLI